MSDRVFAGSLKSLLEGCLGFEVFLAHDDLTISNNWPVEIWENLSKADFVIAVISVNFLKSSFANQEIGIALAKKKRIVPISLDRTNPPGFLKDTQAYKCSTDEEIDTKIREQIDFLTMFYLICIKNAGFEQFKTRVIDLLINSLSKSPSFKFTSIMVNLLIDTHRFVRFTDNQLSRIAKNAKMNPNVYKTDFIFPKLRDFLRYNYGFDIDFVG